MSGRGTTQSLGSQQGIALMTFSVCYINEFQCYFNFLVFNFCDDVVCIVFVVCADHEM